MKFLELFLKEILALKSVKISLRLAAAVKNWLVLLVKKRREFWLFLALIHKESALSMFISLAIVQISKERYSSLSVNAWEKHCSDKTFQFFISRFLLVAPKVLSASAEVWLDLAWNESFLSTQHESPLFCVLNSYSLWFIGAFYRFLQISTDALLGALITSKNDERSSLSET